MLNRISIFKKIAFALIFLSIIFNISYLYLGFNIAAKETTLQTIRGDIDFYLYYYGRAISADNFKRVIRNIPNSSEQDIDYLESGFNKSLNHAARPIIAAIGNESLTSIESLRKLPTKEKIEVIYELNQQLFEKYNLLLKQKESEESYQNFFVVIAILFQFIALILIEFENASNENNLEEKIAKINGKLDRLSTLQKNLRKKKPNKRGSK